MGAGYAVKASTTSPEKLPQLKQEGFEAHLLKLGGKPSPRHPSTSSGHRFDRLSATLRSGTGGEPLAEEKKRSGSLEGKSFFDTDVVIISIPPKRRPGVEAEYPRLFERLIEWVEGRLKAIKIIFISSTSVYPNLNGEVDEDTPCVPEQPNGVALVKAEKLLVGAFPQTTILRLGGLIGAGRGRGPLPPRNRDMNRPVNLIHQKDAIGIIAKIIALEKWGEIFNGVAPTHPSRKEYYASMAGASELPPDLPLGESLLF